MLDADLERERTLGFGSFPLDGGRLGWGCMFQVCWLQNLSLE
jgi:hypothetical protein